MTYDSLDNTASILAGIVKNRINHNKEIVIIGVPRGGLWLAQILAYQLDVDKSQVMCLDNGADLVIENNKQYIVCDDIYDTGKQYKAFSRLWEYPDNMMVTHHTRYALATPKNVFYGEALEHNNHIYYPWDIR